MDAVVESEILIGLDNLPTKTKFWLLSNIPISLTYLSSPNSKVELLVDAILAPSTVILNKVLYIVAPMWVLKLP